MPIVALPDGREVDFPDGVSESAMTSALQRDFPDYFKPAIPQVSEDELRLQMGGGEFPVPRDSLENAAQNAIRNRQLGVREGRTMPGIFEVAGNLARAIPADIAAGMSLLKRPEGGVDDRMEFAASASGNIPAAIRGIMSPSPVPPLPIDTKLAEAAQESLPAATVGRISQDVAATAPLLAVGGLPSIAQKAAMLGFTAEMLSGAPEIASQLGEELGKPEEQQDRDKLASLYSQAIQVAGFSPLAGKGAAPRPSTAATVGRMLGREVKKAEIATIPENTGPTPAIQLTEKAVAENIRLGNTETAKALAEGATISPVREQGTIGAGEISRAKDTATAQSPEMVNRAARVTEPPTPSLESPEGASVKPTVTPEVTPAREFVGMGGAVPGEFANKPTTPTSIKNAQVDVERAQRGLPAAIEPARRSFGKVWDEAMARIDHDPLYPDTLLSELRSKPRSLTDAEDAVLLHRQVDLQNEYGKATRALAQEAEAMKNFPERQEFYENEKARVSALSDELFDLYEIGKKVGTETGRGLNARKMLAYEDFTLANMEMQRRAINEGKPLTEAQSKETVDLNKKIEQTQKAFDEYTSKSESVGAEKALNEAVSEVQRSAKRKPSPSLEADKGNTTAELKSRFSKGDRNNITDLVQKLARQFVEGGIRERNALIDAVHDVLVGIDPAFTRRETMDAISGYGAFRQLTKDEISVKLRDLKGQMQQVAKLEDMQAGRPPLKTGVERRIPSPEESRLIKLVNEAKNEFQIPIEDPNTQLKSSLDTLKSRLKNRTTELQGMLERKEFAKKPKRIVQMDPEANRLHFEMSKAKAAWHEALMKDRLARRSVPRKIWDTGGEVMNTSRALLTSMDLSAVLRQGGFIALAHPVRAAKSIPAMLKAFASEAGQHAVDREIVSRKNYPLYNQSKLYLSEHGQKLSQMEEAYMSRWADKIPLVAGSQRAYVTFLNKLRADSFDAMANALARNKELTPAEANAISNFINVATGRGNLGMKENALVGLNTVFFAPRYVASRFQLLAGQPFYRGNTRTRVAIANEYARYALGIGLIYALATMDGAEIESDPRSSDFGKLKYGNTRLDPISGLAQTSVLLGRLGSGETKTARGNIVPIRGEKVPFGSSNSSEVMGRFVRSKLAPVPGAIVNTLTGKDVIGKPVTPESTAQNLLVPLSFDEIAKTMQEQGVDRGTAMAILSILGMGLQNYDAEAKR